MRALRYQSVPDLESQTQPEVMEVRGVTHDSLPHIERATGDPLTRVKNGAAKPACRHFQIFPA